MSKNYSSPASFRVSRRGFLRFALAAGAVGSVAASGTLAACSAVGPSADDGIRQLRDYALRDVALRDKVVRGNDQVRDYRKAQSDVLQDEVDRQCGTKKDGSVPETCRVERSSLGEIDALPNADANAVEKQLHQSALASFDAIKLLSASPAGLGAAISTGIILCLADVAAEQPKFEKLLTEVTIDDESTPAADAVLFTEQADIDALAHGLTAEYALIDNLTTLHARTTDGAERKRLNQAIATHRGIRDAIVESYAIPPKKKSLDVQVPTPAASYVLVDGKTATDLADNATRTWREVVERAESPDLRVWATRAMATAALAQYALTPVPGSGIRAFYENPTPGL